MNLQRAIFLGNRTLEWGSNVISRVVASVRADHPKYSIVLLVGTIALAVVYKDFSQRVHTEELVSKSLLGQSAWLVHRDKARFAPGPKPDANQSSQVLPGPRTPYVPPEASIVITPKDPQKTLDQVINVKVIDTWGFTAEPGLDISLLFPGIGLDLKWFYFEKVGTEIGIEKYFGMADSFSPTLGLSYRLDKYKMLQNTELKVEYAPLARFPASFGIRLDF